MPLGRSHPRRACCAGLRGAVRANASYFKWTQKAACTPPRLLGSGYFVFPKRYVRHLLQMTCRDFRGVPRRQRINAVLGNRRRVGAIECGECKEDPAWSAAWAVDWTGVPSLWGFRQGADPHQAQKRGWVTWVALAGPPKKVDTHSRAYCLELSCRKGWKQQPDSGAAKVAFRDIFESARD
jgi:hypothetical protein